MSNNPKNRVGKLEEAKALMTEAMAEFEGQTVTPEVNEAIRDKIEAVAEENGGMWIDYLQRFVRLARPVTR